MSTDARIAGFDASIDEIGRAIRTVQAGCRTRLVDHVELATLVRDQLDRAIRAAAAVGCSLAELHPLGSFWLGPADPGHDVTLLTLTLHGLWVRRATPSPSDRPGDVRLHLPVRR